MIPIILSVFSKSRMAAHQKPISYRKKGAPMQTFQSSIDAPFTILGFLIILQHPFSQLKRSFLRSYRTASDPVLLPLLQSDIP